MRSVSFRGSVTIARSTGSRAQILLSGNTRARSAMVADGLLFAFFLFLRDMRCLPFVAYSRRAVSRPQRRFHACLQEKLPWLKHLCPAATPFTTVLAGHLLSYLQTRRPSDVQITHVSPSSTSLTLVKASSVIPTGESLL